MIERDFVDYIVEIGKNSGFDSLSSRLLGILYVNPTELSLDELSEKTGYSLASISNKMRILESIGMSKRIKKPGSKKVFYYVEKDLVKSFRTHFERVYRERIVPGLEHMPLLIEKYGSQNLAARDKEKLKIIRNYYMQVVWINRIYPEVLKIFEKLEK